MPLIQWSSAMSVHVCRFDLEHQKLISYINRLHDAMAAGNPTTILKGLLADLTNYTRTHFANEEKLMQDFLYNGLQAHKLEHEEFIFEVQAFAAKFESGSATISIELMNFLKSWLINHIQKTDREYAPIFQKNGLK